jgi:hypothetical protein
LEDNYLPARELYVAFACDAEDNHPNYVPMWSNCGSDYEKNPPTLNWSWSRYWRCLSECFKSQKVPVTWLIRVDNGPVLDQMLTLFRDKILELKSIGDEIGIHIHTFSWNPELSKWVQTTNPAYETKIVLNSLEMFKKNIGFDPVSVRMGWNTMSNEIMRTLDANGLLVDASAIPKASCYGKFGKRDNIHDWSRAPSIPYHPSSNDYQSPGNMKIVEIPISTLETNKSNIFANLVNRLSGMRSLAKLLPLARGLNLNPHHHFHISPYWSSSVYSKIIATYCKKAYTNETVFLLGTLHACDILNPITGKKNAVLARYLSETIEKISSLSGIDVIFTTLSEMAKKIQQ